MSQFEVIEPAFSNKYNGVDAFFTLRNDLLFGKEGLAAALKVQTANTAVPNAKVNLSSETATSKKKQLFKHLGLDSGNIAWANQVHGNNIKIVSRHGLNTNTDGLITTKKDLALVIQVADCAAVLLYEPELGCIAALHAGWRGAAANIVGNTFQKLKKINAEPANIRAFISPCISQQHFEVGEEVAAEFPDRFVDRSSYKKPHVNLKELISFQLRQSGVLTEHIEVNPRCTMQDDQELYSYRRQNDNSGRMLAVIRLLENGNTHES